MAKKRDIQYGCKACYAWVLQFSNLNYKSSVTPIQPSLLLRYRMEYGNQGNNIRLCAEAIAAQLSETEGNFINFIAVFKYRTLSTQCEKTCTKPSFATWCSAYPSFLILCCIYLKLLNLEGCEQSTFGFASSRGEEALQQRIYQRPQCKQEKRIWGSLKGRSALYGGRCFMCIFSQ